MNLYLINKKAMKHLKFIPLLFLFVLYSCSTIRVVSDYDSVTDFSKYKTFAFYKPGIDKAKISDLDKLCEREELLSKEDYFKYVFVRNPWHRIASLHNMGFQIKPNTTEKQREADFNEWMHSKYFQKVIPMADFVLDHENNIAVDGEILNIFFWLSRL